MGWLRNKRLEKKLIRKDKERGYDEIERSGETPHETLNLLIKLNENVLGQNVTEFLDSLWQKGGSPYIKHADPYERPSGWRRAWNKGELLWEKPHIRASYKTAKNAPDTLRIAQGNLDHFLAEMSHAIQFEGPQELKDSLSKANLRQKRKHGDFESYGIPGTVEFEAHEEIQPKLLDLFMAASRKDETNWLDLLHNMNRKATEVNE
jgi:hypothetical protein